MTVDALIPDRYYFSMSPGCIATLCYLLDVVRASRGRDRLQKILPLLFDGYTHREIARKMGIHHKQVYNEIQVMREIITQSENIKIGF